MRMTRSTRKPGAFVGTRKAEMTPRRAVARSLSVTAKTMQSSAIGELVVQIFRPVSRQPSPSSTARVRIAWTSEPAPGSERPKHIDRCAPRRRVSLVEEGTTQTVVGLIW